MSVSYLGTFIMNALYHATGQNKARYIMTQNQSTKDERIWQVVYNIPKGSVATYGQVAKLAELPGYARYVGYVMKKLPQGSKLPWYRVVNAKGSLSFDINTQQFQRQKSLLEKEGIVFINGKFSLKKFQWRP